MSDQSIRLGLRPEGASPTKGKKMKELIALLKSQIAFEFEQIGELLKVVSVAGHEAPVLSVTIIVEAGTSKYLAICPAYVL